LEGIEAGNSTKQMRERVKNAYLLFYERVNYFNDEGQPIPNLIDTRMLPQQGPGKLISEDINCENL